MSCLFSPGHRVAHLLQLLPVRSTFFYNQEIIMVSTKELNGVA